ncbi:MAG: hypothetical protein V8S74_02755 [Lachnospirales bacterium]
MVENTMVQLLTVLTMVTGTSNASGICGFGYGEISNCYNAGIVMEMPFVNGTVI